MLKLTFILKEIDENTLALRLHWGFRVVFALLSVVIFASMIVTSAQEGGEIISTLLIAVFVLIALYNESWYFTKSGGGDRTYGTGDGPGVQNSKASTGPDTNPPIMVRHFHGLVFLSAQKKYSAQDLESVEVKAFRKGSVSGAQTEKKRFFQRDLLSLCLIFSTGERKDIEITENKNKTALQRKAASISDFMDIPYHSEV